MKGIKRLSAPFRPGQSGASAVEFAFVFPLLLAVLYGGVVYTYVFVLQEAITFSAQQGAQAAVAVVQQTNSGATTAARKVQADNAALSALSWLPGDQYSRVSTSAPATTTACLNGNAPPSPPANSFIYQISFNLGGGGNVQPLFPTLGTLPLVGNISLLPGTLTACAIAFT